MLTLNVMVGLDFKKDKVLPTLTLMELGNLANAQSESGEDDSSGWFWESTSTTQPCTREICWIPGVVCDTFQGTRVQCVDGWSWCYDKCDA